MTLEQQVASLELSKKLEELGVPQNSLFYWTIFNNGKPKEFSELVDKRSDFYKACDVSYSAFTVAELGEMLPSWVYTTKDDETNKNYTCWFGDEETPEDIYEDVVDGSENIYHAETEADARAKMLIWLIENKYV